MIYKEGTKPMAGRYRLRPTGKWWVVNEVYRGANLVWAAIRSCFGAGFWVDEKPWLNNEGWKNE